MAPKSTETDIYVISKEEIKKSEEADFETAIVASGFGKFNLILALIVLPSSISLVNEITSMSYVFPAAECDLSLKLSDKGLLNASTYIGMISSGFMWGYLVDTLGRKKLILIAFILNGIFVFMSSLAQSFSFLMFAKFMSGFIISGPYSAITSYISEFHCSKHRPRVQLVNGITFGIGTILTPLLAWVILSTDINLTLFNGYIKLHPWNIFLLILSSTPIISAIAFSFLPETPKFLMTAGRNAEALKVFQMVYRINTGKPAETYPIKVLFKEKPQKSKHELDGKTKKDDIVSSFQQFIPLFHRPHVYHILLVSTIQLQFMMGVNSLRLWLPQIFQAINDYQFYNNGSSSSLCIMLDGIRPKKPNATIDVPNCVVNTENATVYVNTIIVASMSMVGCLSAGFLITELGKIRLLVTVGIGGGISAVLIYLAKDTSTTLIMFGIHTALGNLCANIIISVVIDLFPTTLRAMTISITMMTGRIGAMIGNLIFPYLLQAGCLPPFFFIGTVMTGGALLSLLVPNTDLKPLQ